MSSDWKHLEIEFKKFRLQETPFTANDEEPVTKSCSCTDASIVKSFSLLEVANSKLKVKDKKGSNQLIKPARLKVIGNCYAKKLKGMTDKADEVKTLVEDFTSEAFLKMRISNSNVISPPSPPSTSAQCEPSLIISSQSSAPSSSSLNCSTQAKLQPSSLSTTVDEMSSTIDEMSDFLAYHLSLFNHRDNLIDSMYT